MPHSSGSRSSLRMQRAKTAMMPPIESEPVSPMNICAGKELYHRNPSSAPPMAAAKTTSSEASGMYMMLR